MTLTLTVTRSQILGAIVRYRRRQRGFSQRDVAQWCGLAQPSGLSKVERGFTDLSAVNLVAIAHPDRLDFDPVYDFNDVALEIVDRGGCVLPDGAPSAHWTSLLNDVVVQALRRP